MSANKFFISEIWIYPIKSLKGIRLQEAALSPRGLQWDRRWMLLDTQGNFLTQRTLPEMALMSVSLQAGSLRVTHTLKNLPPLEIPLRISDPGEWVQAPVWDDRMLAWYGGAPYDEWFSEALEQPCRLVYMPDASERTTTGKWSGRQQSVSFADGYPVLLTGQGSLDDLNTRLAKAVPMDRFRPNLVVEGALPFAEDQWHEFSIGVHRFWAEKPCSRCVLINTDQQTAQKAREPLQTLSAYRRAGSKVLFGQNVMCEAEGIIKVGDRLEVKSYKPDPLQLAVRHLS